MHLTLGMCLHAAGQALSLVVLLAGVMLFLLLLRQWRRGVLPFDATAAAARLQARPWRAVDAGLLLFAIFLPQIHGRLAQLGAPAGEPAAAASSGVLLSIASQLLYYALLLTAVLLAARHTGMGIGHALGVARATWKPAVRTGLVLGLATLPLMVLLSAALACVLPVLGLPHERQAVFDMLADPGLGAGTRALLIFGAIAAAPLAEEAVFRGVVFPALLRGRQLLFALLLVNALFALLHLNAAAFLPLLAIGFCFSAGMLATGSLVTPIVMHAIFNGEMLLLFFAWPRLAA